MMNLTDRAIDIAISTLKDSPILAGLKSDFEAVYKYQEAIYVYASNHDEAGLSTLRIGTILAFSVIGKIIAGKDPKNFDRDDWRDILDNAADYGVKMDPQRYTEFVFELFATYIDFSVDINKESINDSSRAEIKGIAAEIRDMTGMLESGNITEPDYVDRCLWSSFEAMIKLLAAYKTRGIGTEYAKFIEAVADFSVQYGRLALYERELNLLNGYIEGQEKLDRALDAKYAAYLKDLQKESDRFNNLLEHAFCEDFEHRLRNSVILARQTGVSNDEILDSAEKIDVFFMG